MTFLTFLLAALILAINAGDADRAVRLTEQHIHSAKAGLLRQLDDQLAQAQRA